MKRMALIQRFIQSSVILLILIPLSMTVSSAEPDLQDITTSTGTSTTVTMTGGATKDNGQTYQTSFTGLDEIDISATINIPSADQGQTGNIYIFIEIPGLPWFQLDTNGIFNLWNEDFNSLNAATENTTLQTQQSVTIISDIVSGLNGLDGLNFNIHIAYSSNNDPGLIIYNSSAIVANIAKMTNEESYYADYISPFVQSQCVACHTETGLASIAALIFVSTSTANSLALNYAAISDYILNSTEGSETILSKPRGVAHGGGVQLASGTDDYNYLENFVGMLTGTTTGDGDGDGDSSGTGDFYDNISYMSDQTNLRKAAILFAGRLPTQDEMDLVDDEGESGLRSAIRDLMIGENFENFLMEGANNRLLTDKYLDMQTTTNVFDLIDKFRYPQSLEYLVNAEAISRNEWMKEATKQARAYAREPLRLIVNVVNNERSYTEILTADYIMVNPYSDHGYDTGLVFADDTDVNEWREGEIHGYYRWERGGTTVFADGDERNITLLETQLPYSGILTSPMFLGRFPSTATNRNRARARWTYQFFLGVDIESLAARTTDADALADTDNPTLNNPNCTVCHNVHDPVAGAFQNWGDLGHFRDQIGGNDSLPISYKFESDPRLYDIGDTWYSDMLEPGFESALVDDAEYSLQWLGQQIVADERFASGTVKFWFQALFGQEILIAPEQSSDADFTTRLSAFEAQNEKISEWADLFRDGTTSYGAYNLKDMLVEMAVSPYFRAESVTNLSDSDSHVEVGMSRLLTPEELERKLTSLTGYSWVSSFNPILEQDTMAMTDRYRLFYGGIDSDGITDRSTEMNALMFTVVAVMANEVSCPITVLEFSDDAVNRLLFPLVEATDTPDSNATAIKENIQYLHSYLLGEELELDDEELAFTYQLFTETRDERLDNDLPAALLNPDEACDLDMNSIDINTIVFSDPNQTIHAWIAVLAYLLSDFDFLHE